VRFEARDVNFKWIAVSLAGIGIVLVATAIMLWPLYGFLSRTEPASQPGGPLITEGRPSAPPEPRLQGAPGHETAPHEELRQLRQAAAVQMNSYAWIDRQAGIARIPINEAIRIMLDTDRLNKIPQGPLTE
jgi:hypothetical protein